MRFTVFGDWGYGTSHRRHISDSLKEINPHFNILLGDNFYPDGVSERRADGQFQEYEKDFGFLNNYVILGNHDWLGDVHKQILYTLGSGSWIMPYFFYDFFQGDVHFIMLDTCSLALETTRRLTEIMGKPFADIEDQLVALKKKQMRWLDKTLMFSKGKVKIVCGHYPVYSNGMHGNNDEMISEVLPLLRRHKTDMYLSGHDHSMQHIHRFGIDFFVLGSGSESSSIVDNQDGTRCGHKLCGFASFHKMENGFEIELIDEYGRTREYYLHSKKKFL